MSDRGDAPNTARQNPRLSTIPPNNINLAFPMSEAVRNAFRNPNNNGV